MKVQHRERGQMLIMTAIELSLLATVAYGSLGAQGFGNGIIKAAKNRLCLGPLVDLLLEGSKQIGPDD